MTILTFPSKESTAETADQRAERLWNVFVMAAQSAQASLKIEDGIAAGRAWQAFLKAFEKC
jgi:hypothetical protein